MATILIVEHENQVRVFAQSYLRRQGHRTISAANVKEALALIDAVDDVDVLFSEIRLNGDALAGVRLARQAVRRQPGIKIVYAAEHAATDGRKTLLAESAAVLSKPYRVGDLKNALGM